MSAAHGTHVVPFPLYPALHKHWSTLTLPLPLVECGGHDTHDASSARLVWNVPGGHAVQLVDPVPLKPGKHMHCVALTLPVDVVLECEAAQLEQLAVLLSVGLKVSNGHGEHVPLAALPK